MALDQQHHSFAPGAFGDTRGVPTLDALVRFALRLCATSTAVHCSATLTVPGRPPETIAATSDLPIRADWLQHQLGQGPDLAAGNCEVAVSNDMARDPRWPDFGRMAVAVLGVFSVVRIAVPVSAGHAGVKFFSDQPTALDLLDIDGARRLAGQASRLFERRGGVDAAAVAASLPSSGCSTLAVALGIVMARHRLDPREAFLRLQQSARTRGVTVYEQAFRMAQGAGRSAPGAVERRDLRYLGGPEMWREPEAGSIATPSGSASRWVPVDHEGRQERWAGSAAAG